MKIKAITPLGTFTSVEIPECEMKDLVSVLIQSSAVANVHFPINKDKTKVILLPCETVKNSVFELDYTTV